MKFLHKQLEKVLEWGENQHIGRLVIEEPKMYRKMVEELVKGDEGEDFTIIDEKEKKLTFKNDIEVVLNPVKIEFNNRRTTTLLMKILVRTSLSEEFYLSTNRFKTNIIKYLTKVVDANDFGFVVDADEFDLGMVAKGIGLKIIEDEDDFVEQVTDYMTMMAELVGIRLFVFVGLSEMLSEDEVKRLERNIFNHQLNLLLVERRENGIFEQTQKILVDEDLCEI